jgi:hypothetical protein
MSGRERRNFLRFVEELFELTFSNLMSSDIDINTSMEFG